MFLFIYRTKGVQWTVCTTTQSTPFDNLAQAEDAARKYVESGVGREAFVPRSGTLFKSTASVATERITNE